MNMGTLKLSKKQFDLIRETLLSTKETQEAIAGMAGVSTTMVSVVNNARTWGNYRAGLKAKHQLRGRVTVKPPTKVERAKAAGLKPQDREDRATTKLAADLDTLSKTPTREEFDNLQSDVTLMSRKLHSLTTLPFIGKAIESRFKEATAAHFKGRF